MTVSLKLASLIYFYTTNIFMNNKKQNNFKMKKITILLKYTYTLLKKVTIIYYNEHITIKNI